jgi:hypothetical protein
LVTTAHLVDRQAMPLDPREPSERDAIAAGLSSGQYVAVIVDVSVKNNSSVSNVVIERSSQSVQADARAIIFTKALHWQSAMKEGKAIDSTVRYVIRFHR